MDLSRLPEPLRSNLRKQLESMPAEYRQKLESQLSRLPVEQLTAVLSKNSALIEKLAGKKPPPQPSSSSTAATLGHHKSGASVGGNLASTNRSFDPHNHYNSTIGRGDMPSPPLLVMLVVFAGILALIWAFADSF
jgi:hypothetical protein